MQLWSERNLLLNAIRRSGKNELALYAQIFRHIWVYIDNSFSTVLPASLFLERLASGYAEGAEESLSRDEARALASRWVADGYLVCRLPAGAEEETYELTSAGLDAIRLLSRFQTRRVGPTESRLEMMSHAIARLASSNATAGRLPRSGARSLMRPLRRRTLLQRWASERRPSTFGFAMRRPGSAAVPQREAMTPSAMRSW